MKKDSKIILICILVILTVFSIVFFSSYDVYVNENSLCFFPNPLLIDHEVICIGEQLSYQKIYPNTNTFNNENKLMGNECSIPILLHLEKHSNLFDEEFEGQLVINAIGLPEGITQEKFNECVDFIIEKRNQVYKPSLEQLQLVLDYCNDTSEEKYTIGIEYFNDTHYINNSLCEWQKIEKYPNSDIDCIPNQSGWVTSEEIRNQTHIYDKFACEWEKVWNGYSQPFGQKITTNVFAHNEYHKVNYQISNGNVNSLEFDLDFYSVLIKITPTDEGELSLDIPTGDNGLFRNYCEELKSEYPPEIMVLRDGEEIIHTSSEINTDLLNVKIDYLSNTKLIEIIYVCLV